ncbi:MAG: hypothetical protein AM325_014695 [Candidatus Thorarchaeota archaeon SMTZ1-45]|nr:MAG: hypothetical protein AM325_16105 [Candidatus Thorarchaeota archaeon SMTZ1-45]
MNEEIIIDYSRQRKVNRVFPIVAVLFTLVGIFINYIMPQEFYRFVVFVGIPVVLFFLSLIMGAASKKAIDYIPGKWEKRKTWVSFSEYENMVEQYEDAYGQLYSHPSDFLSCCCSLIFVLVFGMLILFSQMSTIVLLDPTIDPIVLIVLEYSIVAVAGFVIGFRIPSIDAQEFFKQPIMGDVHNFARELDGVPGIRAGMNVELGFRSGVQTIIDAEIKSYVQGLPETVQIQVQVSHSGFAYPYLVGTAYKGGRVKPNEEAFRIGTRYPALLEYSMDKDVMVIVARFNIPERTSSVPHISVRDFRQLAALLATELKDKYTPT